MKTTNQILKKGDVLRLFESVIILSWSVNEDQELVLSGDFVDEDTVQNYRVSAECISIPVDAFKSLLVKLMDQRTSEWKSASVMPTCTEIGGHYLQVVRNNEIVNQWHLHNGFGDGFYRLKFIEGMLSR